MRNVRNSVGFLLLMLAAIAFVTDPVRAADIAFDSAGDSAYNSGWTNGSNGGYGWGGPWSIQTGTLQYLALVGDSTAHGLGDINSPRVVGGRSWGMLLGDAVRPFNGPLSVGQTFSLDWVAPGDQSPNFSASVILLSSDGSVAAQVEAETVTLFGVPDYVIFPPGGRLGNLGLDSGVAESSQGLHVAFTRTSSGLNIALTSYADGASGSVNVPFSGQAVSVDFSTYAAAAGATNATPYINNISITPEPSSIAVLGLAVCGLLVRRR